MDTLSKSDPFVITYLQGEDRNWVEVGRTEIVVNSLKYVGILCLNCSPMFVTRVLLNYRFESVQHLRFQVYDADEGDNVKNVLF